jgi:hypothetical protein
VVNALPVRSRIEPWQIFAERLNLQSWKWASDASVFALPVLSLNSLAVTATAQGEAFLASAAGSLAQTLQLATEANVFALPSMALNSSASGFLAQMQQWTTNVTAANYGSARMDLLRVRFDSFSNASPLGVAIMRSNESPSALASAEALVTRAEARAKARKQKPHTPREQK